MTDLLLTLRALIRDELRSLRLGDLAVITSVFPHADGDTHNYEVNVRLREGELELRQVPMCTPHVGMAGTPAVGELVLVTYVGGDANRPVVLGRLYSDEHNPPAHAEGEWTVRSPLGGQTHVTLDKDGSVIAAAGGTRVTLKKDGEVHIEGAADLKVKVAGKATVECEAATINASGEINLGEGGSGVITHMSHKCFFTGAPLVPSMTVKAKG